LFDLRLRMANGLIHHEKNEGIPEGQHRVRQDG
jgi:hypothetical protein